MRKLASTSQQRDLPLLYVNLYRAIKRDWVDQSDPSTQVFVRAWCFGLLAETIPACVRLALSQFSKTKGRPSRVKPSRLLLRLVKVLKDAFSRRGLALFFGVGLGCANRLDTLFYPFILLLWPRLKILKSRLFSNSPDVSSGKSDKYVKDRRPAIVSTFLSSFVAAYIAFSLQGNGLHKSFQSATSQLPLVSLPGSDRPSDPLLSTNIQEAIRQTQRRGTPTLNFTLFLLVRAVDTIVRAGHFKVFFGPNYLAKRLADCSDTVLFVLSSWRIMWVWFYKPWLLPPSYDRLVPTPVHYMMQLKYALQMDTFHCKDGPKIIASIATRSQKRVALRSRPGK